MEVQGCGGVRRAAGDFESSSQCLIPPQTLGGACLEIGVVHGASERGLVRYDSLERRWLAVHSGTSQQDPQSVSCGWWLFVDVLPPHHVSIP